MGLDFTVPDLTLKYTYHDEDGNEIADTVGSQNYEEMLGAQTMN